MPTKQYSYAYTISPSIRSQTYNLLPTKVADMLRGDTCVAYLLSRMLSRMNYVLLLLARTKKGKRRP
jgi:hypothetical protein